ncbi:tetratricopeptide repeat protein [Sphingosinicella rhizophila]|uniref:Tetratricopeptide repeat protein n=1 Tax=Sphingosinicella rhizophila TaxID=3050082 RepID=A0ABU3QAS5_9SPHN|nr:tetratricopeptide repeat protein [Sphingosinicella sp. GR2756]MDT9600103.1 tetratricopeptide repeat protein [Sphingosinicella sp. GR2756]
MKRKLAHAAWTAVATASLGAAVPAQAKSDMVRIAEAADRLREMAAALERLDCKSARKLARPLLDFQADTPVDADIRQAAQAAELSCKALDDPNGALADLHRLTRLDDSPDMMWHLRFAIETELGMKDAAVTTIEEMTQGRGAALNALSFPDLFQFVLRLDDAKDKPLRKRMLIVMSSSGYQPDTSIPMDLVRYRLAEMLVEEGKIEEARAIVTGLENSREVIDASLHPKLRGLLPNDVDFRAIAEKSYRRQLDNMVRNPDRLEPIIYAASELHRLGRPQEALDLLMAPAPRTEGENPFTDLDEQLNWWWDAIASSHFMLGKADAGFEALKKGGATAENEGLNVSQILNLAMIQVRYGRPADALETLKAMEGRSRSPYGEMVLRGARSCALARLERPGEAVADLDHLAKHEKDGFMLHLDGLLCHDRIDDAAALLVRKLEEPDHAVGVLLALSSYEDPPVKVPQSINEAGWDMLKARPEVRAAAERAGGTRRFPIQPGLF